ncbi:unnamed protein product [Cyclocybe aegerita]|uniref:Uncharacterized protein n=1 Tax=Cyclocybe aegerita TaxID=1973307 RepID=A0A8S0W5C1_CYCAE|nr:unnamed protein product [Cyclocybe aegerita]
MGLDVDDTNSAIQYSSGWTNRPALGQYQETGHATSQAGASLTFTFEGTAIRMICTVPGGHDLYSRAQVVLDGGSPRLLEHTTHPSDFYNDQWYDSGSLFNGRHTITVTNPGGSSAAPFVLDKFNIDGTVVNVNPPAAAPTTTSTRREVITSTQVVIATRVTTTDAVISGSTTRVSTLITSSSTSTATSTVSVSETSASATSHTDSQSTESSSEKTVTAVQFLTSTAADGSVSTQTTLPSTNDPTSASATSEKPLGLIIGSVLGGTAVILLFLLLLICLRRRNRTHILLPDDREARPSRHRDTAVTPFNLNRSGSGASRSGDLTAINSSTGHTRSSESANDHPPYIAGAAGVAYLARNISEKSRHLYISESPTSLYSPSAHPANDPFTSPPIRLLPATRSTPTTLPHLDTGGGGPSLTRPNYMSGETVMMSSTDIYARTPALGPVDSRDVPPAYQSVRNTNSGASFAASTLRNTQGAG